MLRKQFIGLSFLSVLSLWAKKTFGDTFETEKKMILLKRYFICSDSSTGFTFSLEPFFTTPFVSPVTGPPSGFTELYNSYGSLYGYTVDGASNGTYNIEINATELGDEDSDPVSFMLQFLVAEDCATEIESCCDENTTQIRWLGREGGIKQWNFPGIREFDIQVGDANTFKNADFQKSYSQRKDIYSGKRITTGDITKSQVDFLDELKYCIQAWEWTDEDTPGTFYAIPILIDNGSFRKYDSKQKFFDVSVQYVLSSEIITQTQ